MTDICWQQVNGIIERGHQVASGLASNSPYPRGTIEMQIPIFQKLGLDLTNCFPGTLNVFIYPQTFEVVKPEFTFKNIEWTDQHPAETFSFSRCRIILIDSISDGWIYYPHPETKKLHFQSRSILEIITAPIPNIKYGSRIEVEYNSSEIIVKEVQENSDLLLA